ncbi:MAG: CHAT domain-containing protein [Caulobacteraceae bacterium]
MYLQPRLDKLSPSLSALAVACAFGLVAGAARAALPDVFPLGESAKTGAVCQAVREFDDPAVQLRGASAWAVRCRGWGADLGHLYLYSRTRGAVADGGPWRANLAARAKCDASTALALPGVPGATEARCVTVKGQTAYVAYASSAREAAADGFAPLADILQAGLRIVTGAQAPPKLATEAQAAAAGEAGGSGVSLAEASDAAYGPADRGKDYAYTQNQSWRFPSAEQNWRPLALAAGSATSDEAEAYLNWALAYSNLGQFDQADKLFAQADEQLKTVDDPFLATLALNYRALDARNRRDFNAAISLAQQSIEARRHLREIVASPETISASAGTEVVIGRLLADALNHRDVRSDLTPRGLTVDQRLEIPDAQADLVIGSAKAELGDDAGARQALEQAESKLVDPRVLNSVVWLRAQVEAELARLDIKAGQPAAAKARLTAALAALHQGADAAYLAGSPVEAYLLFQLGRAEAAAGQTDAALADYDRGFRLFRQARGSLGASADAAGVYFDLLLAKRASDAANARAYDERFFEASQSVVSEATASTVAELAKRIAAGGGAAAGTARALEDTRHQIEVKRSALADLATQPATAQTSAARVTDEGDIKALTDQATALSGQLLTADPRYGQLEFTTVDLDQMQKALRPGEAYLKIVLLGDKGYGILVTPEQVKPYPIDLGRADAAADVKLLRKPFDGATLSRFDVDAAHRLYETLLGPAQDDLAGVTHLIYDPDGALISLPIATLVADQASVDLMAQRLATIKAKGQGYLSYADVNWLGRKMRTSLVVSAPSFMQSRNFTPSAAPGPFLGFGDAIIGSPDDPRLFAAVVGSERRGGSLDFCQDQRRAMAGLPRLPETADEVRTVGDALGASPADDVLGPAFTDTAVETRPDLDQYRVVYFATHGLLPQPGWCLPEPALVTSLGASDRSDALLEASSILNLKLDADLVVLSACNTGGGAFEGGTGPLDDGEALGGLVRAFIYAGSRGLVVSHWEVDSASTQALMTGMFDAAQPGETISEAEALRRSELKLMDSADHSHPYYWAAFTVVGDGARPMPARAGARM